jgi:Na+/melibiose symporter-like transporter
MSVISVVEPPRTVVLDPPASAAELSWWQAKRRLTIRNSIAKSAGMLLVFGLGVFASGLGTNWRWFRVFTCVLMLPFVGMLMFVELRARNREADILSKRQTDDLEARQAQFLELLGVQE